MAKSKSFFGLRTGSTKTMTFQVNAGKQITKDRVEIVKNPRTLPQMVQRMCMATVGAAYQSMRDIVDHSFEAVSYGQKSMAEFMRLNLKAIRNDYLNDSGQWSYNPYRDRNLYPSPFVMSRGSLQYEDSIVTSSINGADLILSLYLGSWSYHNVTISQFAELLGMQLGDILTIPYICSAVQDGQWHFGYCRLTYKVSSDEKFDSVPITNYFSIDCPDGTVDTSIDGEHFFLVIELGGNRRNFVYSTCILSRKSASGWLRSNASFLFPESPVNIPNAATALATYPVGDDYILNGGSI